MRRHVVALAVAISLAPGCGNDSVTGSANPAEGIYGYVRDIVTRARVGDPDLAAVISAACDAYADGLRQREGDSATFDQYIADLFDISRDGLDQARVDRSVTGACGSFRGDVRRFLDDLSASLGIGLDELRDYMTSACADFGTRDSSNATDPYAPEHFDPLVSSVFEKGGLDRDDIGALVDAACRDLPVPPPPEVLAIEPKPALTPGDASAPGDRRTWCRSDYVATYPPLSDADRASTLDAYDIPQDERSNYEVLRLIPTGLGGTNDRSNLFPVGRTGSPGAADKVEIDRRLTELVCAGSQDLATARANLVKQWPTALAKALHAPPPAGTSAPAPVSVP